MANLKKRLALIKFFRSCKLRKLGVFKEEFLVTIKKNNCKTMSQNTRPSSSSSNNILTLCIGILLALLAVWNCKVEAAQIRQFNKNLEGKKLQNKYSYESAHPESGIRPFILR